jgi:hypothetical protein
MEQFDYIHTLFYMYIHMYMYIYVEDSTYFAKAAR